MQKVFQPIEYVIFGIVLVSLSWAALYIVGDVLSKKHDNKSAPSETELMLKAEPKDIIYSEAYREKNGETVVKYAYLDTEVGSEGGEDISRRTPTSQTYVLEQFEDDEGKPMEKLKTVFITKPQFYNDGEEWRQIQYATTTQDIFSQSGAIKHINRRELAEKVLYRLFGIKPVFAATSTFYPNADTESTSVDGHVGKTNTSSGTGCDASGFSVGDTVSDSAVSITIEDSYFYDPRADESDCTIYKGFLLFDTSALPDSATIDSGTVSIYVTLAGASGVTVGVYTSAPASNTALVTADYNDVGTVLQSGTIALNSLTASAYNNLSLNSTGISNISKTSITKFGLRLGSNDDAFTLSSADETGTGQDPKLEIVYDSIRFSFGQWFPF